MTASSIAYPLQQNYGAESLHKGIPCVQLMAFPAKCIAIKNQLSSMMHLMIPAHSKRMSAF